LTGARYRCSEERHYLAHVPGMDIIDTVEAISASMVYSPVMFSGPAEIILPFEVKTLKSLSMT